MQPHIENNLTLWIKSHGKITIKPISCKTFKTGSQNLHNSTNKMYIIGT